MMYATLSNVCFKACRYKEVLALLSSYGSIYTRENESSKEYQSPRTVTMQFRKDVKQNSLRI